MTFPNLPYKGDQIPNQPFNYPEVPATFDRLFGTLVPNIQLDPNPSDNAGGNGWVRPADWLPMPEVSPTEEKFVGLFAVYDLPENFIAVYFEGDYTVDWGDGTVEDFSSGETAQHSYSWSDIPADTLTSEGYCQVLVTVTPQVGQNLTIMDLSVRHENLNINNSSSTPWLDLAVSMPNADSGGSLRFGGYEFGVNSEGYLFDVQRINIVHAGGMTDFTECFYYFTSLASVTIQNCPNADSFLYLFDYCQLLKSVSLLDTSSVTNMNYMFYGCYALTSVPLFDTSSVTNMTAMFSSCTALTSVTLPDTSSVADMTAMFLNCTALTSVILSDISSVENMGNTFAGCPSLTSVSLSDTSGITSAVAIFNNCNALQRVVMPGTVIDISYAYCLLSRQAIVDIFNGLGTASSVITVTGNYGAADLTPEDVAIAVDKGWTVFY